MSNYKSTPIIKRVRTAAYGLTLKKPWQFIKRVKLAIETMAHLTIMHDKFIAKLDLRIIELKAEQDRLYAQLLEHQKRGH